ncbi:uncharacterized protein [Pagrus major]|uniref:uncharacterized protein n=1 Tax=Pagrus major TaxID=143350 RepID=UPI003CC8BC0C
MFHPFTPRLEYNIKRPEPPGTTVFYRICIMNKDDTVGAKTDEGSSTTSNNILRPSSPSSSDVQQLFIKEEGSPEWSPSLDQKHPEHLHIKQEQEELRISQEGEQLHGLREDNITRFPLTAVTVKSEDDEEKPQISQLHQSLTEDNREAEPPASSSATQIKTETDGEDCGGSEPSPSHPQLYTDEKASDCSETDVSSGDWQEPLMDSGPETEDSDSCCEETRAPESGGNDLKYKEDRVSDVECNAGEKICSCLDCGQGFHCKGSLQGHTMYHLGNRSPTSLVNNKCCRVKEKEDSQMRVKIVEKPFDCSDCGTRFSLKRNLDRHMKIHTGEKPFRCSVCGNRFKRLKHLELHMKVHTGDKPFGCDVCGKRYIQQGDLKTHMRVHTGEKPFCCDVCGKRFTQQGNLKTHMRVHTGEKPFGCDVCGKRFTQQGDLNTHTRVHTGEKPFGCGDCGMGFSLKSNLERHMRAHTGEKPFGCDVCGNRFTRQGSLKAHMRVHSGDKPFGCDTCGKRFNRSARLKAHKRVHTGEKPFGCGVCGKRFKQAGSLKSHVKVHSG